MSRVRVGQYLAAAKDLNEAIGPELNQGRYPVKALQAVAERLAREEGWRGWKRVKGTAAPKDDVPFELWMFHLSLLTTAWVFWLYGAKARDRLTENMRLNTRDLLHRLGELHLAIETDIFALWDQRAWDAIVRDVLSGGNREAHIHYGLWDGLSRWQKVKVWVRSLRR